MADIVKNLVCVGVWVISDWTRVGRGGRAFERLEGWRPRVDTSPTVPVRMAGYASRTSPSQGMAHPLAAKALALADAPS